MRTGLIRTASTMVATVFAAAFLYPAIGEEAASLQDLLNRVAPLPDATIYIARDIITMNPDRPHAEAVAVVSGHIAAVGSPAQIEALAEEQAYIIDETFADKVLVAGMIDPHVHPWLSALTMVTTVISIEDWETPTGFSPAVRGADGYHARLVEALAAHNNPD